MMLRRVVSAVGRGSLEESSVLRSHRGQRAAGLLLPRARARGLAANASASVAPPRDAATASTARPAESVEDADAAKSVSPPDSSWKEPCLALRPPRPALAMRVGLGSRRAAGFGAWSAGAEGSSAAAHFASAAGAATAGGSSGSNASASGSAGVGASGGGSADGSKKKKKTPKKKKNQDGLIAWLWDQALHLWHGFRLLAVNVGVTWRLKRQLRAGHSLTRRERQLLETTAQDLVRLLPFSAFIIVPGGELLLPVALAMFPSLLPSTFDTSDTRRRRQMMSNLTQGHSRRRVFEFLTARVLTHENFEDHEGRLAVFRAISRGGIVTEEDIRSFVSLFEDDGPMSMDAMPYYVLRDLCSWSFERLSLPLRLELLTLPHSWSEVRMRYALSSELRRREEDDLCLERTGLDTLNHHELEQECVRRRLRWLGSTDALRTQLQQWLSLSLDPDVPNHMLLFMWPCATEADVWLNYTSKTEREHVIGLDKFRDTPTYNFLRTVLAKSEKKKHTLEDDEQERLRELQTPVREQDIEELKQHVEDLKAEDLASRQELRDMREVLQNATDDDLLALFDTMAAQKGRLSDQGNIGVETAWLSVGLVEVLMKANRDSACKPSRIFRALQDFDVEKSDVLTRDEFMSFIRRMRRL
eukprot:TRINITY_DN56306_c0_g1_i1.p1 TRINITY_DN56306_c0_g1~~TRINITY_DN56306_c0_g1_i1.p1  ORF type:complete len:674 (+),score=153.98 TRINITY_DN56306_c0_g1_i1:95-2023(+)